MIGMILAPLGFLCLFAQPEPPREEASIPEASSYFRSDHLTGANYLRLAVDGTYEELEVEHMGRSRLDHGTWHADGSRLFLRSETCVLDVVSGPYRVSLVYPAVVAHLPRLKESVLALHAGLQGRRVKPEDVSGLRPEVRFDARSASPSSLLEFSQEIDRYLADPDSQRVFPFQCFSYHSLTFLVPVTPGAAFTEFTLKSIKAEIDKAHGGPPTYIFLRISQPAFEHGVGRNYPLKFYPELNPPDQ